MILVSAILFLLNCVSAFQEGYCATAEITSINPSSIDADEDFTVGIVIDNCGDEIPEPEVEEPFARSVLGPDVHPARLTLETDDVHWPEGEIHPDNHHPEVPAPPGFVEHLAEYLRPPIVHAGKEPENTATEDHVVEVRHDVVRVGLLCVRGCNCVRNT